MQAVLRSELLRVAYRRHRFARCAAAQRTLIVVYLRIHVLRFFVLVFLKMLFISYVGEFGDGSDDVGVDSFGGHEGDFRLRHFPLGRLLVFHLALLSRPPLPAHLLLPLSQQYRENCPVENLVPVVGLHVHTLSQQSQQVVVVRLLFKSQVPRVLQKRNKLV